jgi:dihydroorotate dehydrogenase
MLYPLLRPILFRLARDPEAIHERTLNALAALGASPPLLALVRLACAFRHPSLRRELWGLPFVNPLGLAAGFDKNAVALPAWGALGFGFVEVGTVTRLAQPGNPRPRLFRLPADRALVNRLGFNNEGAEAVAARLARAGPRGYPLGISLGKSKLAPLEEAADDYCASLGALYRHGDYFAVNVSSPNTPGLRALQGRAELDALLAALQAEGAALAGGVQPKPLLVKVAPDLSDAALDELIGVCSSRGVAGLIATNTTIARPSLRAPTSEAGGLSGAPLRPRALEVVRFIARQTGGAMPIIGVGGIFGADDASRLLDAGASLLQAYTGFVYQGPGFAKRVSRGLARGESAEAGSGERGA